VQVGDRRVEPAPFRGTKAQSAVQTVNAGGRDRLSAFARGIGCGRSDGHGQSVGRSSPVLHLGDSVRAAAADHASPVLVRNESPGACRLGHGVGIRAGVGSALVRRPWGLYLRAGDSGVGTCQPAQETWRPSLWYASVMLPPVPVDGGICTSMA
jgi:hypothetical protein